jgi:delta 1-pyrroline-5-carboxylate dehydrogenase
MAVVKKQGHEGGSVFKNRAPLPVFFTLRKSGAFIFPAVVEYKRHIAAGVSSRRGKRLMVAQYKHSEIDAFLLEAVQHGRYDAAVNIFDGQQLALGSAVVRAFVRRLDMDRREIQAVLRHSPYGGCGLALIIGVKLAGGPFEIYQLKSYKGTYEVA